MSLEEKFKKSAEEVRKWSKRPPDADMLEMYSLYKQATVGDVNTQKPSDIQGSAKWEAWSTKKGLKFSQAKEQYIAKAKILTPKYA